MPTLADAAVTASGQVTCEARRASIGATGSSAARKQFVHEVGTCGTLIESDGDFHYRSVRPDGTDHRLFSDPKLTSNGISLPGLIDRSFAPTGLTVGSLVELLGVAATEAEYDVDELIGSDREPGFKLWRISELLGLTPMIWTLPGDQATLGTD